MFCSKCGKEITDEAFCPYCGQPTGGKSTPYQALDAPNPLYALIAFFIPLAGLVLFIASIKAYPRRAKSALKGYLARLAMYLIIFLIPIIINIFNP